MKFTIFTPTFNRAHLLPRLFESLTQLDFNDFEWVIVDDGSTDETKKVVSEFISNSSFPIRYLVQENQGKHAATNLGVEHAKGDFFFIVDSDDWLPAEALSVAMRYTERIQSSEIAGIAGKRSFGDTMHDFPFTERVSTPLEMRYRFKNNFDLAEIYKTEVLKEFPFPVFSGEKFITESLVWFRIASKYQLLYFNEFIYHCEYQADGLTDNYRKLMETNPKGSLLYFGELLRNRIPADAKKTAARNFNSIARLNGHSQIWVLWKLGFRNYLRIFS